MANNELTSHILNAGLKVGRMIRTIWVTWVTFLEGQVSLICKLNYLDVTRIYHMYIRKQFWHLVSEWWTLGLMNVLKYHWYETSLLSQAVLKHVVSKDFIFKKSVQGTGSVSCQEWRNLWHCSISKIFLVMLATLIFLKRKLQHVGHKWVMYRSHSDCSMGQWVNRWDRLSTPESHGSAWYTYMRNTS